MKNNQYKNKRFIRYSSLIELDRAHKVYSYGFINEKYSLVE